jgi:hypothetical protein
MSKYFFLKCLSGLVAGLLLYFSWTYLVQESVREERYCGVVKHKIPYTRFDKYGTGHADPILVIDFEEKGIREIRPDWNSYQNAVEGKTQCYKLHYHEDPIGIAMMFSGVILILVILICNFAIVYPLIIKAENGNKSGR